MGLHRICEVYNVIYLLVVLVLLVVRVAPNNGTQQACQTPSSSVLARISSFIPTTLTSMAPFLPLRLRSPGWMEISTVLECAHQTLREFPNARGYLYNESTALCTPVLYIASPKHIDAREVDPSEGTLYLASEVCSNGFQIYALGPDFEPICAQDILTKANFATASETCASYGGFLASVKTTEKLDLIKTIGNGQSRWVGLDDIDNEGVYIWHSDGSELTSDQRNAVFSYGEPNDHNGNEDCTEFRSSGQKLNDQPCSSRYSFICEIPFPTSTC